MQIDWFTVVAQALNFLVLMWLLKRFLYNPILNAISTREKLISDQLAHAKAIEAEAQKEQVNFKKKNEAFDKQRAGLLRDAKKAAETERDRLLSQAKEEVDILRNKRKEALVQELNDLKESTARKIQSEVFFTTKKVLHDLVDESLEDRMIAIFITHLRVLSAEDLTMLGVDDHASQPVHISSAFVLSEANKTTIKKAVKETLNTDTLIFKIVPALLSGIELSVAGHKLAWSISDYMSHMKDSIITASKNEASEHAA